MSLPMIAPIVSSTVAGGSVGYLGGGSPKLGRQVEAVRDLELGRLLCP
ncbi:hypothetical protein [Micromonospora sp. WMMD980]|nr:hypothetical protein [Micromonospora sp. WMMD980]MDG4801456.1 hypothetical protein [Micromonospora sp. WMMD980]